MKYTQWIYETVKLFFTADLVTFTEEILNGKPLFLFVQCFTELLFLQFPKNDTARFVFFYDTYSYDSAGKNLSLVLCVQGVCKKVAFSFSKLKTKVLEQGLKYVQC